MRLALICCLLLCSPAEIGKPQVSITKSIKQTLQRVLGSIGRKIIFAYIFRFQLIFGVFTFEDPEYEQKITTMVK